MIAYWHCFTRVCMKSQKLLRNFFQTGPDIVRGYSPLSYLNNRKFDILRPVNVGKSNKKVAVPRQTLPSCVE